VSEGDGDGRRGKLKRRSRGTRRKTPEELDRHHVKAQEAPQRSSGNPKSQSAAEFPFPSAPSDLSGSVLPPLHEKKTTQTRSEPPSYTLFSTHSRASVHQSVSNAGGESRLSNSCTRSAERTRKLPPSPPPADCPPQLLSEIFHHFHQLQTALPVGRTPTLPTWNKPDRSKVFGTPSPTSTCFHVNIQRLEAQSVN